MCSKNDTAVIMFKNIMNKSWVTRVTYIICRIHYYVVLYLENKWFLGQPVLIFITVEFNHGIVVKVDN